LFGVGHGGRGYHKYDGLNLSTVDKSRHAKTISKDLDEFVPPVQTQTRIKTASNPQSAGRPKGSDKPPATVAGIIIVQPKDDFTATATGG